MKITAIIVALNESEFIQTCIKSIYPFCDRIKIQTNYDRGWSYSPVIPDETVKKILDFPDQEGKISLNITRIPDEALARNWLMKSDGYAINHYHSSTVSHQENIDNWCQPSDYFWVIDGDEIYDPDTIPNILEYVQNKKPNFLKIRGINFFKKWNYQIVPNDGFYQPGFIKAGILLQENRYIFPPFWFRLMKNKYWNLGKIGDNLIKTFDNFRKWEILPENIAVFYHGAYVGNDERIKKKISLSVHNYQMQQDWYERVWKNWTPETKNFHPVDPSNFQQVQYIPTEKLPSILQQENWPDGYID